MAKPTMKDIRDLSVVYNSEKVQVQRGDLMYQGSLWRDGAFVVTIKPHEHEYRRDSNGRLLQIPGQKKRFYGESAWSDAQRLAQDFDFNAHV